MVEFSHHEYLKPFLLCTTKKMSNNQSVAHSCLLGKEIQHSHGMQHHIHGDDQWDLVEREAMPDGPTVCSRSAANTPAILRLSNHFTVVKHIRLL
jgi:hypothetical protein